jgi:hypothetical protein
MVKKTNLYRAYGLIIQSPIRLPELNAGEGQPDVVIRFGKTQAQAAGVNHGPSEIKVVGEDIHLFWDDIGRFLVRAGREIIIEARPDVQEHVLRLFILGTTLAMLLCQRGLSIFHASAVAIGDEAIAFAGMKGAGKSTLAAAMHAAGHELIADDIVAIDTSSGSPMVVPGFPYLKLWPDSVTLLGHDPERLPRLRPGVEKRGFSLSQQFSHKLLPLRHFCIISPGPTLDLQAYEPRDALRALMPHWYGARFGMERLRDLGLADCFRQCAAVVSFAKIHRLTRRSSPPMLGDICSLLSEQLLSGGQNPLKGSRGARI